MQLQNDVIVREEIYEIYRSRKEQFLRERERLKGFSRWCVFGKLLSFLLFALTVYLAWGNPSARNITTAVALLLIYIAVLLADNRLTKQIRTAEKKISLCLGELKSADGDYSPFRAGERFVDAEHDFSYDLDLFGRDSLFNRINRTITERGEKILAGKLSNLCRDKAEIERNAAAIAELAELFDWRLDFLAEEFIPDNIADSLTNSDLRCNRLYFVLPYISAACTLILLALAAAGAVSFAPFTVMFLFQLLLCIVFSKQLTRMGLRADRLYKDFAGYHAILRRLRDTDFTSEKLQETKRNLFSGERDSMRAFGRLSGILNMIAQRSNVIVYIALNGLVLNDIMLINQIRRWRMNYSAKIDVWLDEIGSFDALVCLSVYAYNNPGNVVGEVLDDSDIVVEAAGMYHPFLPERKAVPNDFILRRHNIHIITGANMAGKSTFLRTVGVNYVLACCGVPVCARRFRFSVVSLFTSMRTTDNLSKDISYFNAELLRLEKLIEHIKRQPFTLIILDEILKGTNSADKLRGSKMFLSQIARYEVSGIVATHDLGLARLEDAGNNFSNYCFEIEPAEQVVFSYKISKGTARNMNASILLERILNRLKPNIS